MVTVRARADRIQHGRFYTPGAVADLTLSLVLGGRPPPRQILDPSCGDGVFLRAARRRGIAAARLAGRDIDAPAVAAARQALGSEADVRVGDLFDAELAGDLDAVVGNPPYVRQERLTRETKERIAASLARAHPGAEASLFARLVGRGDLAACALARCVALLAPGGRLGFVVSTALLDADYARPLWRLFGDAGRVLALVASPNERWFADAAVNTAILVYERGASGETRSTAEGAPNRGPLVGEATVARLAAPVSEVAGRVAGEGDLAAVAEVRRCPASDPAALARALRAPRAWTDLADRLGPRLVPLGELASIRRGTTSGANDIFYTTRRAGREAGIEAALLEPLVRTPRARGPCPISIDPGAIEDRVLVAPDRLTDHPGARRYLEARQAAAARPSLAARSPWWRLPRQRARLFLTKAYARRFVQRLAPRPLDCDQRVYAVTPRRGIDAALLAAALNGSAAALAIEALGRASMGQGALEWTVADARALPVIDVRRLEAPEVLARFARLAGRPIGNAEDEVGRPDREALDRALLPDVEPRPMAEAVAEAAWARERRARSPVVVR